MSKIKMKHVKSLVGVACELVLYGVIESAARSFMERINTNHESPFAGYDDAVGAIMKSDMYSHDKREAIESLKRYSGSEFYKAIMEIARDTDMYSHDKAEMIKVLSEE